MRIETSLLALLFTLVALVVMLLKFITGLNSDLAQVYATIIPVFAGLASCFQPTKID